MKRKRVKKVRKSQDVAVEFTASPITKELAGKACKEVSGYYPRDNIAETSDGYETTTPRKRKVQKVNRTSFFYTKKGVARNLMAYFFVPKSEEPKNESAGTPPTDSLETWIQMFETVTITADDLKNTPNRKTVPSQNAVMGESAKEVFNKFLKYLEENNQDFYDHIKSQEPKTLNWCHIVAFIWAACVINTQVSEDLTGGSRQCNEEMIPFETGLRNLLRSNESFSKMKIDGYSVNYKNFQIAKEIILDIKLTYPQGNKIKFQLKFDGLTINKKPKEIAYMILAIVSDVFSNKRYAPENTDDESDLEADNLDSLEMDDTNTSESDINPDSPQLSL